MDSYKQDVIAKARELLQKTIPEKLQTIDLLLETDRLKTAYADEARVSKKLGKIIIAMFFDVCGGRFLQYFNNIEWTFLESCQFSIVENCDRNI